ncbi:uncharacterized protein LOC132196041 [Neocloeon triangulifer]|uniref:uncharacterized protein LOC132196041 n=1 Tax=Neocloeon triangulifer TaxID=2078957 RepID=UPI00286EC4C0|nr:uncharacterized protein LOC132196041 [Neocloeon triangulifer]
MWYYEVQLLITNLIIIVGENDFPKDNVSPKQAEFNAQTVYFVKKRGSAMDWLACRILSAKQGPEIAYFSAEPNEAANINNSATPNAMMAQWLARAPSGPQRRAVDITVGRNFDDDDEYN